VCATIARARAQQRTSLRIAAICACGRVATLCHGWLKKDFDNSSHAPGIDRDRSLLF
jgi:hypothetical protein